jgi:hypothetical protein
MTPNEKYVTMRQSCGYVAVPLNGEDYVELMPERWQVINSYGIRIKHRTYDDRELGPLRRQHSGVVEKKGLWEIHHDPYDISRIWVRDRRATDGSPCSGNTCAASASRLESWPGPTSANRFPAARSNKILLRAPRSRHRNPARNTPTEQR